MIKIAGQPDPSFSVVIPAFNAADYVCDAIRSAMDQSVAASQIIVVDDGSSDGTVSVVEKMREPLVTLIRQENGGAAAARNAATVHVSADYIAYLDADDLWEPDKLRRFRHAIMAAGEPALVFSDFRTEILETGERLSKCSQLNPYIDSWPGSKPVSDGPSVIRFPAESALGLLCRGYPMYPSAFCLRKDALIKAGGWNVDWIRSQDFELCLRLAKQFEFVYLNECHSAIRRHSDHGDLASYVLRQTEWDIRALEHHANDERATKKQRELVAQAQSRRMAGHAWCLREAGRWKDASKIYARLISVFGLNPKWLVLAAACRARGIFERRDTAQPA